MSMPCSRTLWIGKTAAWRQRDGKAHLDVAGPGTIKLAVLQIPA